MRKPEKPGSGAGVDARASAGVAADVVHSSPAFLVATWQHHVIVIWRQAVSVVGVAVWSRAMTQLQTEHPGRPSNTLVYIEPGCRFADAPETLVAHTDALKRFGDAHAATVVVYEGAGFGKAALRARLMAIHGERKTGVPYALTSSLAEAVEWLAERGAADLREHALTLAPIVEALRSC